MFTEILKNLRIKQGLTQKQVAEDLGIAQPNYQQWESGKRSPSGETLVKLANYFNVSTDYLLGLPDQWARRTEMTIYSKNDKGFDVPVTFETLEQAEAVFFLAMLSPENQDKIFEHIFDLTKIEDIDRIASYMYAEKDKNRAISFVKEDLEEDDDYNHFGF